MAVKKHSPKFMIKSADRLASETCLSIYIFVYIQVNYFCTPKMLMLLGSEVSKK